MATDFDEYLRASHELNDRVKNGTLPIAVTGDGYRVSVVTFKKVPPLLSVVASSQQSIAPGDIPAWNQRLWPVLEAGLKAAAIRANYPAVYFYRQCVQGRFVLEIGFPVPVAPDPIPGGLRARHDDARWCASAVLVGPFLPHIGEAWKAANAAIAQHGFQPSGEDREIYHHMTDFICTEVQIGIVETPDIAPGARPLSQ